MKIPQLRIRFSESGKMSVSLTESDLKFLVETLATERRDYEHIIELVRDKEDLLEQMLEDRKLLERLQHEEQSVVRVSPYMLFSVWLRAVRREIQERGYVYQPETRGRRLAVFEGPAVVELLSDPAPLEYLAGLLCSFVKTNTAVIYWKERGAWHRRRFNDSDLDDMIALAGIVDPELRSRYYQRIGDIALFLSGIFPDQALRITPRSRSTLTTHRTLQDYEQAGRRFYALAAREPAQEPVGGAVTILAEKFVLARSALNHLSDHYLRKQRARFFEERPGD